MSDTVMTYLDTYCERAGAAGLMGEPLNFFTNAFFIIAAILAGRALLKAQIQRKTDLWLLVVALFSIGIGSGLWHGIPSGTTVLMDVIPITIFINIFLIATLRRLLQLSWNKVVMWWGIYFVAGIFAQKLLPPDLLNGTIMYIPTYLALVAMTVALRKRDPEVGKAFLQVVGVWSLSLVFRTVDMGMCQTLHIGTHFLWHTFNAWVLWRLLMVMIRRVEYAD